MTSTRTSTWSAANVRRVLEKVHEDLQADVIAGFCSAEAADALYEDLSNLLLWQAIQVFQLQYEMPDGRRKGFQYKVNDDGSVMGGDESGGRNLWVFPRGTTMSVVIGRLDGPNASKANEYLTERGWGSNGRLLDGRAGRSRVYAHNGYALTRTEVGD